MFKTIISQHNIMYIMQILGFVGVAVLRGSIDISNSVLVSANIFYFVQFTANYKAIIN